MLNLQIKMKLHKLIIFLYIKVLFIVDEKIKVEIRPTPDAEIIVTAVTCPGSRYPNDDND